MLSKQINSININGITYFKDSELGRGGEGIAFLFKNPNHTLINMLANQPSQLAVKFFIKENIKENIVEDKSNCQIM